MTTGQIALREQSGTNCRYARRSTVYGPDRSLGLPQSCDFTLQG